MGNAKVIGNNNLQTAAKSPINEQSLLVSAQRSSEMARTGESHQQEAEVGCTAQGRRDFGEGVISSLTAPERCTEVYRQQYFSTGAPC